jgi:hypothetical protein
MKFYQRSSVFIRRYLRLKNPNLKLTGLDITYFAVS